MKNKVRLDHRVHELLPQCSRTQVQSLIMQGRVKVSGKVESKVGTYINKQAAIEVSFDEQKYVSRAGFKLERALDIFKIDVRGIVALDAGLSTGGFTDCLLQRGIDKVYGVDVGYGQVHEKIRHDSRVVVMERTHLNNLPPLDQQVDLVTLDLSFISVLKVLATVKQILKTNGLLVILIKPQFEAQRHEVGRGGIVKDPTIHEAVVERVTQGLWESKFHVIDVIDSPILGTMGNKEFLAACSLEDK